MIREIVREMFYHGYNNYMENAYPDDELKPLSCTGRRRDKAKSRGDMDEVLANYSLTLLDSLDTLVVLGDYEEFERASYLLINSISFNNDITINLFEVNIRALGGLLSSHLLAKQLQSESLQISKLHQRNDFIVDPIIEENEGENNQNEHREQSEDYFGILTKYQLNIIKELQIFFQNSKYDYLNQKDQKRLINQLERTKTSGYFIDYNDEFLKIAIDLGLRLLPAFQTTTGIPFSRVNLKTGVPKGESTRNCLAGAGTLLLEFGTLSRLSGYSVFEVLF